jgi:uncharacterized membrane protein YvbJ
MKWKCPNCGSEDNNEEAVRCLCGYEDTSELFSNHKEPIENERSMSPITKTVLICLGIELLLILLCRLFTESLLMALVASLAIFAAPSLYLAPYIYKRQL